MTAVQNEVVLTYHKVCVLYFIAVVFVTTRVMIHAMNPTILLCVFILGGICISEYKVRVIINIRVDMLK